MECPNCGRPAEADGVRCRTCHELLDDRLDERIDECYRHFGVGEPGSVQLTPETFREKTKLAYARLEWRARAGERCSYADLWGDGLHPTWLKSLLGSVGRIEYGDGRPLIPSIVVSETDGLPSDGYFRLVETLPDTDDDATSWPTAEKREWWRAELDAVYDWWGYR